MANVNVFNMRKGLAIGGPRNKVVLDASINWNGRVRKPPPKSQYTGATVSYYPGKYVWQNDLHVWEWKADR